MTHVASCDHVGQLRSKLVCDTWSKQLDVSVTKCHDCVPILHRIPKANTHTTYYIAGALLSASLPVTHADPSQTYEEATFFILSLMLNE